MPNVIQIRRTVNPDSPPPSNSLAPGELGVELAGDNPRLWVGTPTSLDPTGRRLIADVTRAYVDGQFAAAGSGTVTNIATGVGLTGGPITTAGEIRLIVPLAVALGGTGVEDLAMAPFLLKTGGTLTGPLVLAGPPQDDLEPASKLYVDDLVGTVSGIGGVQRITAGIGLTGGQITTTGTIALEIPVPITRGGTGGTNASEARANLGIAAGLNLSAGVGITLDVDTVSAVTTIALTTPVALAHGGTGAASAAAARTNLGITLPLPIADGGTGAVDAAAARSSLGIPDVTFPVLIANGGTSATNLFDARANLGIPDLPLSLAEGGTGSGNAVNARANLGIPENLGQVPVAFMVSGKYQANQTFNVAITMPLDLPAALAGTRYYAAVGPAQQRVFNVRRMRAGTATTLGTLIIDANAISTVTLAGTGGALQVGDALQVQAPTVTDANLEDFCITVACTRS